MNSAASRASGTLAVSSPYDTSSDIRDIIRADDILVKTVFDPATQRVIPATEDAGLAAAKVGLVATSEEGRLSGSLVVKPGDGSDGVTVPIVPGSTATPPERLARERDLKPMQFFPVKTRTTDLSTSVGTMDAMNAPGVTLLLLNGDTHSSLRYKGQYVYRLYGLTGATS